MINPIKAAMNNTEYSSYDAIAKELIKQNSQIVWGKPRSVSAKIGQLDKGTTQWWNNRPDELKCLTTLLDVLPTDLGIHDKPLAKLFRLEDFPELPPLDLKRNKLFKLGKEKLDAAQEDTKFGPANLDEWFDRSAYNFRQPSSMDWLCFPDQLERELFTRGLESAGTFNVVYVETLAEAREQLLNTKAQVISVQRDGGVNDLHAIAARPDGAGLLVIAPFMLEVKDETNELAQISWERTSVRGLERRKLELSSPKEYSSLKRWTWTHSLDWRYLILDWVELHLKKHDIDTLFTAQEIKQWLDRFDPKCEWFCTLSDMLQLCSIGHWSSKQLPDPNDEAAGEKLVKILFKNESSAQSFKIQQLARSRWESGEHLWKGDLPLKSWLSIAPQNLTYISRSELDVVAQGKTISERLNAAELVANKLQAGSPDTLLAQGLLKESVNGHFDFKHPTMANLLIRDDLISKITRSPLSSWSYACFDPSRRIVVDSALDVIPIESLVNALERLDNESPNSAESIGVSEALFMAIGRRIIKKEKIPVSLLSLAEIIRGRLDLSNEYEMPLPLSRTLVTEDEQIQWVTTCWAWSLEAPLEKSSHWLFPGGSSNLSYVPYWLPSLESIKSVDNISNAWIDLLKVTDQWLDDLDSPILDAPDFLSIGLIVKAALGRWPVDDKWWRHVFGIIWAEDDLINRTRNLDDKSLLSLWKSFETFARNQDKGDRMFEIKYLHSRVRHSLLKRLEPDTALDSLTLDERHYFAMRPQFLPPSYRGVLLKSVKKTLKIDTVDALSLFNCYGATASDAIESYLDDVITGWAAAVCLWKWSPDKVLNKLIQSENLSINARNSLLQESPIRYIAEISDLLVAKPYLFDIDQRVNWARKYLPFAGFKAGVLLSIMELS